MLVQATSSRLGFRISFDSNDRSVEYAVPADAYEPFESQLFLRHVHDDSIVFDVGANIVYYTLLGLTNGKIIAFEPNLQNYLLLICG